VPGLVEAIQAERGHVEHVGLPGERHVGGRPRHAGPPHHARASGAGHDDVVQPGRAADDGQVVGGVVDGRGPDPAQPEPGGDRDQGGQPSPHPGQVVLVHLPVLARRLVRVAHPEQQAALLRSPVQPRGQVEHHRYPPRIQIRVPLGHRDLVPDAARRDAQAGQPSDLGQLRAAGQDDQARVDPPLAGVDPAAGQAAERDVLGYLDPAAQQRHGVGGHVPGRRDIAVLGAEGPAERLSRRQRRVDLVHLARIEPAHRNAQAGLHRHPLAGRDHVRLGEAGKQVALLGEPGVGADLVPLAQVELAGPLTQHDGLGRPALHPDDAGRPAARALPEVALLDQDDPAQPGLAQEVRAPRAHRPAADHHGVSASHWHSTDAGID
jgi:hypothetical protein